MVFAIVQGVPKQESPTCQDSGSPFGGEPLQRSGSVSVYCDALEDLGACNVGTPTGDQQHPRTAMSNSLHLTYLALPGP